MITTRPANPSDAADLQSLYERFLQDADWPSAGSSKDQNFAAITQGERVVVAVSQLGELVGVVTVWEPESFIHFLFVDRKYQEQGVGTELLRSLTLWLPFPWKLKCLASNRRALDFYRQRGWKKQETGQGEGGTYFLLGRDADDFAAG